MKKFVLLFPIILGTFLASCGFGGGDSANGTQLTFSVINGSNSGYSESNPTAAIKKLLGNQQSTIYALNSLGHLWQFDGSTWSNLNNQPGLPSNYFINDFYYANGFIFTVDNNTPNNLWLYNTSSNTWSNLTSEIISAESASTGIIGADTIIAGNEPPLAGESISLLIGYKPIGNLPPQLLNCNYDPNSNSVTACITHSFTESGAVIHSIYSVNNSPIYNPSYSLASTTAVGINNNVYTNTNLSDFNSWSLATVLNAGNILQVLPLDSTVYLTTQEGSFFLQNNLFTQYNNIPTLESSLNPQIMSYDSAGSIWTATSNQTQLYVINSYGHVTTYSINITNGSYAPLTSLFINTQIVHNKIYLGTNNGEVLEYWTGPGDGE